MLEETITSDVAQFLDALSREIIKPAIYLLFALAFVYFMYGLMNFIINAGDEKKRETGKKHMLWGIVGLAVMFSVWGIVNLIISTIGGL